VVRYVLTGLREKFSVSKDYLIHSRPSFADCRYQLLELEISKARVRQLRANTERVLAANTVKPPTRVTSAYAGNYESARKKASLICGFCKRTGHEEKKCWKKKKGLKAKSSIKKPASKDKSSDGNKVMEVVDVDEPAIYPIFAIDKSFAQSNDWIFDSAASRHITWNSALFSSTERCSDFLAMANSKGNC